MSNFNALNTYFDGIKFDIIIIYFNSLLKYIPIIIFYSDPKKENDFEFLTQDRTLTLRTVSAAQLEVLTSMALNYYEYIRLNPRSRLELFLGAFTFYVNSQQQDEDI
jgi:hypothetical protein